MSDNPILRPVENRRTVGQGDADGAVLRQESNLLLPGPRRAFYRLNYDNHPRSAQQRATDKRRVGNPAIWRLGRDLNPVAVSRFTDNPNSTARRKWRARWESNPRLPNFFRCSIAVELRACPRSSARVAPISRMRSCCHFRQLQMGKGVIERRHSMPGIELGPPRLSPRTVRPPYGGG